VVSWKRTFWAVWLANLITAIGMMAFLPFFPSHLESLGLTDKREIATWAGILFGAAPLSAAFASPLWGAIGDRFGRRVMVLRSLLGITLFVGAMAFATNPWQLLVLRLIQGLFSGFVAPSLTLVSVVAPADQQARVSGSLNTSMVLGAIFGPAFGELLRDWVGIRNVYLVVAALAGVSALLVLLCAREDASKRKERTASWSLGALLGESLADLRQLRSNPTLRAAIVLAFWIQFGLGATNPLLELFVRDVDAHFAWLAPSTAALFSAMAVANLISMPLWGTYGDRRGAYPALVRCALWSGAALLLQALAPNFETLLVARTCYGVAMAGASPLAFGVAAAESSAEQRGGAIGVVFGARTLSVALSSMVGGWLSGWIGIRGLFVVSAVVLFAYLALLRRSRVRGTSVASAGQPVPPVAAE
jgi:MFS family permease